MTCALEGKLYLHPGEPAGAALLLSGEECAKLALPDFFYADPVRKKWNGKKVKVVGRAFLQPGIDSDGDGVLMWYAERDRKLALGMCDGGMGIYVISLEASGEVWP
ncbi:hypothetical protein [Pseudoxanthomonas wuyuanensis]|nr:hypothetical protein [Pseudoxanthomonas wuyuanensis]